MRSRPVVLGMALLAALFLTGCGSDEPKARPAPSSAPSPTAPQGLDTTAPKPPGSVSNSGQSAVDYATYFASLVQYAVRTRNARPVKAEAFDQASCTVCQQLDQYIQKLKKDGLWEVGPDIDLGRFQAVRKAPGFTVSGPFTYPDGEFLKVDGTKDGDSLGGPYLFSADLVWDEDGARWRVVDYTFQHKSKL
jgi:hypothetical protein